MANTGNTSTATVRSSPSSEQTANRTSMAENVVKYWKSCLDCICTCGGRRRHRIHPSDPRKLVIPENNLGENGDKNSNVGEPSSQHGESNPTFVPDSGDSGLANDTGDKGNNGDSFDFARSSSVVSSIVKEEVYLVIGDGKYLRVVHVKPLVGTNFVDGTSDDNTLTGEMKQNGHVEPEGGIGEEEDSYWFSNWSRKPRFRSIFEKSTVQRLKSLGGQSIGDPAFEQAIVLAREMSKEQQGDMTTTTTIKTMYSAIEESPSPENNLQEEYNSIDICDVNVQRWSRCDQGGTEDTILECGMTNFAFEGDDEEEDKTVVESEDAMSSSSNSKYLHESMNPASGETHISSPEVIKTDIELESFKTVISSDSVTSVTNTVQSGSPRNNMNHDLKESTNSIAQSPPSTFEDISLHEETSRKESLWKPKKPMLFFIHGLCGSSEVWNSQVDFFEKAGYEMVIPDLVGHGMSSCPSSPKHYVFEALVQDVITIFDHFVTEGRKVVLICHGYG